MSKFTEYEDWMAGAKASDIPPPRARGLSKFNVDLSIRVSLSLHDSRGTPAIAGTGPRQDRTRLEAE